MVKKIWNDPVWSKIIAAGILYAGAWISNKWLHWWAPASEFVHEKSVKGLHFWTAEVSTARWFYWLLILIILTALVFVLGAVLSAIAPQPSATSGSVQVYTTPAWLSYTTDLFDGLRWRWRYRENGQIDDIRPHCPRCNLLLMPNQDRFTERVRFDCERCGQNLGELAGPYGYIQDKICRFILQRIDSGNLPTGNSKSA